MENGISVANYEEAVNSQTLPDDLVDGGREEPRIHPLRFRLGRSPVACRVIAGLGACAGAAAGGKEDGTEGQDLCYGGGSNSKKKRPLGGKRGFRGFSHGPGGGR